MRENTLLEVKDLRTHFYVDDGIIKAVDGVDFTVEKGETLGIVGESGCGKSITSLSIMNMIPDPGVVKGEIYFRKNNDEVIEINSLPPGGQEIRSIRGNEISMIFQEPMTSFTPVYTIGRQITEAILVHNNMIKEAARERTIEMLRYVGISSPEQRVDEYPYQFSGGMRQRAMIAMALSCDPRLLIADEPTTALDVTIEAQILELLSNIQQEMDMSIMMITHDLGVIGEISDKVIVMYMGKVVETASADDLFFKPRHPYTKGLLKSIPVIGNKERLSSIEGSTPNPFAIPTGCSFHPRCPEVMDICKSEEPPVFEPEDNHCAKCWLYRE